MNSWEDFDKAVLARPYNASGFNLIHGIFRLPDAVRAFFEIERSPDNQDHIIDNVSFRRMICDPNKLILNGDFEEPNTKYWDTWGGEVVLGLVTGYGGTGQALKASQRPHLSHGPAQVSFDKTGWFDQCYCPMIKLIHKLYLDHQHGLCSER